LSILETEEEKQLFTELYTQYRGFMFGIANQILKDSYAAENSVHDAFLRLIENLDKFDLTSCHKTKSLIGIVVKGFAVNEWKRRKRTKPLDEDTLDKLICDELTEETVISLDQYTRLKEFVKTLDPIYADTFLLRYVYHQTPKQIAELTGVSEDTVRQRSNRARAKLMQILMKEGASHD
jgi:RNA polymerase sigma-70 factor (ECF subfamily)